MNARKAVEDFLASKSILICNIESFQQGNRDLYRVIAVELRKLLCDGRNSLLTKLFPELKLHPILGYINKAEDEEWKRRFGHSFY